MIGKLTGYVDTITQDGAIIDVNGIGYIVIFGKRDTELLAEYKHRGDKVSALIHSSTKEDGTTLYGFLSLEDRLWFGELIKLNGISGKIATLITGNIGAQTIASAILMESEHCFCAVSGVGKKLANRIINEMKDSSQKVEHAMAMHISLNGYDSLSQNHNHNNAGKSNGGESNDGEHNGGESGSESDRDSANGKGKSAGAQAKKELDEKNRQASATVKDAILALQAMGFTGGDYTKYALDAHKNNPEAKAEDLIKIVLKKNDAENI